MLEVAALPPLVVFEGVDGTGKSTLAHALAHYYREIAPRTPILSDSFPGSRPGSLGEWVYRVHHGQAPGMPPPESIHPAALQLLHVAAHVDAVERSIAPTLHVNGMVILDRYWWSTYAYGRLRLPAEQVWPIIQAELPYWADLPSPTIIYVSRKQSLKANELEHSDHRALEASYRELIASQRAAGVEVHELRNDATLDDAWHALLHMLKLPERELPGADHTDPRGEGV